MVLLISKTFPIYLFFCPISQWFHDPRQVGYKTPDEHVCKNDWRIFKLPGTASILIADIFPGSA